jgi:arylsulfatase
MNGQQPGADGKPGKYRNIDLNEIALYDVTTDKGETTNIAASHPDVVAEIENLANAMRERLGDALLEMEGTENRSAGIIQ